MRPTTRREESLSNSASILTSGTAPRFASATKSLRERSQSAAVMTKLPHPDDELSPLAILERCPYPDGHPRRDLWLMAGGFLSESVYRGQADLLDKLPDASNDEIKAILVKASVLQFDAGFSIVVKTVHDYATASKFIDAMAQRRDQDLTRFRKRLEQEPIPAWVRNAGLHERLRLRLNQRVAHWTAEAFAAIRRKQASSGDSPAPDHPSGASTTGNDLEGLIAETRQRIEHRNQHLTATPTADRIEQTDSAPRDIGGFELTAYGLSTAEGRRRAIADYLKACTQHADQPVYQKHIWQSIQHTDPRTFQYWLANDLDKQSAACDEAVRRVLQRAPETFVEQLRARHLLSAPERQEPAPEGR